MSRDFLALSRCCRGVQNVSLLPPWIYQNPSMKQLKLSDTRHMSTSLWFGSAESRRNTRFTDVQGNWEMLSKESNWSIATLFNITYDVWLKISSVDSVQSPETLLKRKSEHTSRTSRIWSVNSVKTRRLSNIPIVNPEWKIRMSFAVPGSNAAGVSMTKS